MGGLITTRGEQYLILPETADPVSSASVRLVLVHPNPSQGTIALLLAGPPDERVQLDVLDLQGRRLVTLLHGALGAQSRWIVWDGRDAAGITVPTGIYFAGLRTETSRSPASAVRRLMVVR